MVFEEGPRAKAAMVAAGETVDRATTAATTGACGNKGSAHPSRTEIVWDGTDLKRVYDSV